ncbi:ankyrin homolog [Branchiostoma lanceolatum]|uniref:ankyrin homolog n=1 Tax=Branchiostoma lanceolatum TaxID=7740 RepID=UPI00345260F4
MDMADLFSAASNGDCVKIRSLLDEGMDVGAKDGDGFTALHHAAKAGHCPAMGMLLDRGADIEATGKSDLTTGKTGLTVLHLATMNNNCAAIAILLARGANLEKRNKFDQTALHFAASRGDCDLVGLLSHDQSPIGNFNRMDKNLLSALQHSSMSTRTEGSRCDAITLLLDGGADIDARDCFDYTPLHYAALEGNNNAILLLLDRGADLSNEYGQPVLHKAALGGHNDTVNLLLDHGVDIAAEDDVGGTALHIAARYGHPETVRLLCSRGADLAATDEYGEMTPLLDAAMNGHCNVIDVALSLGATLAETDVLGDTALHMAVTSGGLDTVAHLIGLGVEVNGRNIHGATALHNAVYWKLCSLKMAEALLFAGTDCNLKDEKGRTLYDVAPDGTGMQEFLLNHQKHHHPYLKKLCRAKILSILGKSGQEESEIHQFAIPQDLKDYLLFRAI